MRIAVLSDIHSNLVALEAVLAHLGSVDAIWHLGDVVGYGPEPDAVVARLASLGAIGVRGNHDAAAAGGREIEYFNPEARDAMEWTRARITPATRDWLAALPERHIHGDVTLVHGSPRDPIWEYVTSSSVARASIAVMSTSLGLHGHTHVPVAFIATDDRLEVFTASDGRGVELGDRVALVNPGSVGQPRDGDPRASYLVLDPDARSVTWHRVGYDIAAVMAAMHADGLPERLAERLRHGV
jgi:predicted phosphodiesterase